MQPFRMIEFDGLDSTNSYARAHLAEFRHGDVIHALSQTAGHGRWARRWVSGAGRDLTCSVVIKPRLERPPTPAQTAMLSCVSHLMAVSICRLLERLGIQGQIKWPNDVLVEGRKISGILAESVVMGAEFSGVVLGVGLNLNLDGEMLGYIDQPVTSVKLLVGSEMEVRFCRDELLKIFFEQLPEFMERGFGSVRDEYLGRSCLLGKRVSIRTAHNENGVGGVVETVNEVGELVLRTEEGKSVAVAVGEVVTMRRQAVEGKTANGRE